MILSGKQKILILVKTYPTPSKKYDELVCTAGITENGQWVRIYPIELRKLPYDKQYSRYDWVEVLLERRTEDFRAESYRPKSEINKIGHIDTKNAWQERKKFVFRAPLYTNLAKLITDSKPKKFTSLALFKPKKIKRFYWEGIEREWNKEESKQLELFANTEFKRVRKLPYRFKYVFEDERGVESKLMIEDWELGSLFWKYADNKGELFACQKVKEQFFDNFINNKDLYFFLGTTRSRHNTSKNPFLIAGVFYPPLEKMVENGLF